MKFSKKKNIYGTDLKLKIIDINAYYLSQIKNQFDTRVEIVVSQFISTKAAIQFLII